MSATERPLSGTLALLRQGDWIEGVAIESGFFGSGIVLEGRWKTDAAGMAECLRRCGALTLDRTALFLPRGTLMLRRLDLPAATQANLAEVLEFEIDRHFPHPASTLRWGYIQQGGERQGRLDILVAGGTTEQIESGVAPFDQGGVSIDIATPLSPIVMRLIGQTGTEQSDAAIIADGDQCEIALGCHGRLLASRVIDRTGADAQERISNTLQELIARHQADVTERGLNRIFWIGQGAIPPDLDLLLQNDTGAHCLGSEAWTEMLDKTSDITVSGEVSALTTLLALSLREQPCPVPDMLHRPARRKPKRYDLAVAAILAGILALLIAYLSVRNYLALTTERDVLAAEIESMDDTVSRIIQDEKELENIQDILDKRQQLVNKRRKPIQLLAELTKLIPESAYVKSFNMTDKEISLNAECSVPEDINEMIVPLTASPLFKLKSLPNIRQKSVAIFLLLPTEEKSE